MPTNFNAVSYYLLSLYISLTIVGAGFVFA